ncbi:MAG: hypothetical protein K5644_07070 [Lachnospiraceae bacterium]|nr:hypothetical protein [Lachnospiraceae bacterium]
MKKGIKVLIIIASVIVVLTVGMLVAAAVNPRVKFLTAVTRFATETLQDPNFIIYDLDFMGICRDYMDGDIEFEGDVIAGDIQEFGYTSSAKVHGVRSFAMKELGAEAAAKVLFIDVGEVDFYAKDKTLYMMIPSFDNLAYSLTTNTDLFMKAPMLNDNLSLKWFKDNIGNFIEFANDIDIRKSGEVLEDENGTISDEFLITIPQGKGEFIWQFLGMDVPDYDINLSMYITRGCQMRRVKVDLGNVVENTVLTVDGTSMGLCILETTLPDNEKTTLLLNRRGDYRYASCIDILGFYNTKDNEVYKLNGVLVYDEAEVGYDVKLKRMKLFKDDELIGQMYFDGNVHTTKITVPPTSTAPIPLDSVKNYEWEELRDNFQGVKDDVMEDVKEKL